MTEHMVSEESSEFITTIIPEVRLSKVAPPKGEDPDSDYCLTFHLPKVILCIKEVNEKARVLACKLVISLGYAAQRCFKKIPEGIIQLENVLVSI